MIEKAKIKVLDDIEHVLTVPARYVGTVRTNQLEEYLINEEGKYIKSSVDAVPAILTLFKEVVTNSIDEWVRTNGKFANKIQVKIKNGMVTVRDNGRGLPHEIEEKTQLPQSVVAFTQLKAGANFEDSGESIGQNGEGVSLVNIFSKAFEMSTCDGTMRTILKCSNNMGEIEWDLKKGKKKFTEVKFSLDFDKFGIDGFNDSYIQIFNRLLSDYKMCYPKIDFSLNGESIKFSSFKDYVNCYSDLFEVFEFDNLQLGVFPSDDFEHISFVNGTNTKNGGGHVDIVTNLVVQEIREKLRKKFKSILPAHIKNNFGFIVNITNMHKPRFDSQTKTKLENFNVRHIRHIKFDKIGEKIFKNKDLIAPIIDFYRVKEDYKKKQELKGLEKKTKVAKIVKLIDANSKDRSKCSLYIGEGQSAIGSMFLSCRDPKIHAGYPLRGKFITSQDVAPNKLIKNQEVFDLTVAMNLKLSNPDISAIRYRKIIIMTDQDPDGFGIKVNLLNFFYTFWPDLVNRGLLYMADSPLIKAKDSSGKIVNFFSTIDYDLVNVNNEYKIVSYNKGLGSLPKEDYKFTMNNLININVDDNARDNLTTAFSKKKEYVKKRQDWMME